MALLILIKRVGAADKAVGETAGPFRGPRATGGSMCGEARHRCRRRFPEIRPDGASPIAAAKWFRRSCHAENGGKRQRSESAPAETSSPALVPRATPIPSVRAPRRTRRNGSSTSPRASLLGSNRVTSEVIVPHGGGATRSEPRRRRMLSACHPALLFPALDETLDTAIDQLPTPGSRSG